MLFSCGLYLIIQANIGVAPWDVLCFGVAWTIGVKYGTASIGISLTVVLIDVIMKEKIGLGTLIDSVVVGKTVDLLMWLDPVPMVYDNLPLSIGMLPIAFLIMGYGQYIYMKVGLCFGPRDALQVALGRRMPKVPIGVVLTILMLIVLTAGWLLRTCRHRNSYLTGGGRSHAAAGIPYRKVRTEGCRPPEPFWKLESDNHREVISGRCITNAAMLVFFAKSIL